MSKDEIMAKIRECAAKLGRTPGLRELESASKIGLQDVRKHFSSYTEALKECGLERRGCGHPIAIDKLFADWAAIVRKLGKLPTAAEYRIHSRYSIQPLCRHFGSWNQAAFGLAVYAREHGLEAEWKDVLEKVAQRERWGRHGRTGTGEKCAYLQPAEEAGLPGAGNYRGKMRVDRPVYGQWLAPAALAHGPTNEVGVIYLFGMLAGRLGFVVTRMQTEFPDCEAMRLVEDERWQQVRIEFEFESRNFLKHLHRAEDCDLIVCWAHNWPECPLEVVELRKAIG